ncbi:hypothetical protein H5410_017134 [Solanum commersonii]|uniref:WRKY domain-containing protein n=1 Tax=Solanum commersonii TaxID=4109 RepID=A0A9J5ZY88_SOLCO|nr:hypothetical protein H5410_017134 [Solanum commersonii]
MAENENGWDLWAIVRSCSKMNNSVSALVDHGVHEDGNSALVDHSVHGDGNSVNTVLFQEERNCVGDFTDAFAMENNRYFGLDEVISLAKNLNTNSRIQSRNQENQTETIPNNPLVIVEHEEEEEEERRRRDTRCKVQELSKADHGKWTKCTTNPTGKIYYSCSEVENCPTKRHVEKSSKDSTKVIVTYIGQHNHPPPKQHIPNTPLLIVEHEEKKKKKARYLMQSSSTESSNTFIYRGKINERHEILAEELSKADHGRWRKYTTSPTGKSYYSCTEVKNCPAKRHVEKSSKDPTKVIVTYRGQHNLPPPKQHIPMVHRRPNAAAPREDPSSYSSTSTL